VIQADRLAGDRRGDRWVVGHAAAFGDPGRADPQRPSHRFLAAEGFDEHADEIHFFRGGALTAMDILDARENERLRIGERLHVHLNRCTIKLAVRRDAAAAEHNDVAMRLRGVRPD